MAFAEMDDVGTNPARIIPAWTDFVAGHEGQAVHGIGEPIWAERSPAEVVECQRHESLLNLAFGDEVDFRLLCPYDSAGARRRRWWPRPVAAIPSCGARGPR